MPLGEATHTYSILTIGDGLVSQIPAILATIAAGLVVTRTAGEEDDKHLGEAITRQISGQPRVLLITGLLALLMTLVPGFPKLVFAVRSEEHTSELQSLMRISYAVFCLKKKN